MATIKGAICGPRYSIGIPQVRPTVLPQAVKWYVVWKREREREAEREKSWKHLAAVHNAAINGQKWKSCGFSWAFSSLKTIEQFVWGTQNLCAICTRTNGRHTKIHTLTHTHMHTLRTLTRWRDWRKLPLLLLAAAAAAAENTFAFPFSFPEWKPRTKWQSCASPTRDCALSFTHYSHRHIHMHVCCIYCTHTRTRKVE